MPIDAQQQNMAATLKAVQDLLTKLQASAAASNQAQFLSNMYIAFGGSS